MTFMKFSRGFESEADYLGLQYMYKAGYDPQAFISFFEKIQAQEKQKPGTLVQGFSSHPPTPDRIAKSEAEIKELLPPRPEYIVDTSEFDPVKARLAAFEDRKKVIAPSDKDKPTLRQTKTADASTRLRKIRTTIGRPFRDATMTNGCARLSGLVLRKLLILSGDAGCRVIQ